MKFDNILGILAPPPHSEHRHGGKAKVCNPKTALFKAVLPVLMQISPFACTTIYNVFPPVAIPLPHDHRIFQ